MSQEKFLYRHIGPSDSDVPAMLETIGVKSVDDLISKTLPENILLKRVLRLPKAQTEHEYLKHIWEIAQKNLIYKSYIGLGYYNTITPSVILRNIFENPSWYTSYTPYQAEISQGRLEALLNFQTVVMELTGMPIANASLLDEATAAAEAMMMFYNSRTSAQAENRVLKFFVDKNSWPQTIDVLRTRALPFEIEIVVGDYKTFSFGNEFFGALVQYTGADGIIHDYSGFIEKAHEKEIQVAVAADILSLTILVPPGNIGADAVLGSTQRFGIPMGYGGPHAAYFAVTEKYKRAIPGRIIGVTKDVHGLPALRLAIQTREQHIKRERATSNICTAQALLAIMAGMYAVYHGKTGLQHIALHIHRSASTLARKIEALGYEVVSKNIFDTIEIRLPHEVTSDELQRIAEERTINLRYEAGHTVFISIDETTTLDDINVLLDLFAVAIFKKYQPIEKLEHSLSFDNTLLRDDEYFTQDIFKLYSCETEMMRYIKKLERRDISLTQSMISLGSCTMKLNAATEMLPLSWPEFQSIHPFAPLDQVEGYHQLLNRLGKWLCEITGMSQISFQPNSGAAGEYTGLYIIHKYHESKNEHQRKIVLIPSSAHGTNPASAAMAGLKVVVVNCDANGNIDFNDLKEKATQYKEELSCLMLTYPSTHGVFEEQVKDIIDYVHSLGAQVYMDGANMNAQVGLTSPGTIGVDVCHLNLHKTFAIPHGGGGPGSGPVCVAEHLVEFLPTHPLAAVGGQKGGTAVSASPWGSALIAEISYAYIAMLGAEGLAEVTKYAIFNANYMAARLKKKFKILYTGKNGFVAHEMIIDCRDFKKMADVTEIDIAKRLMDYGFHAPTVSFPVHGTLMVEPTESESKQELDRFIDAMFAIYEEIEEIASDKYPKSDNVLKNAPHTATYVASDNWVHPYSRQKAAFPLSWIQENKFWPACGRTDDAFGDRNLVCSCSPIDEYRKSL